MPNTLQRPFRAYRTISFSTAYAGMSYVAQGLKLIFDDMAGASLGFVVNGDVDVEPA